MSLFGALKSGVSGLTSQSSAMGIISDNVANINTTGYKATTAKFSTLVTKQVSTTQYSCGGVQCRPSAGIDAQGLLSSSSYSTDMAISGQGFFVVNEAANPGNNDMWGYTRAGSFGKDNNGYLVNTGGYYLQGWSLLPYDGSPNANVIKVGDSYYMKAYKDGIGNTQYINDNIIDSTNLKPINLNNIGGSATPTRTISLGANLPSSDPIYDPTQPELGGRHKTAALIYDSLGNAHNMNVQFTKETSNSWGLDVQMPSGAATLITYGNREVTQDTTPDVYSARAQLEFTKIPTNHSTISMEVEGGKTYVFEFSSDDTLTYSPSPNETLVKVDIKTGIVTVADAMERFQDVIQATVPSGGRFVANGGTIEIEQSVGGAAITFDVSKCLSCKQSAANPDPETGISSGRFTLPEIDWDIKNVATIDFNSTAVADYEGLTITLGNTIYEFTNSAAVPPVTATSPNVAVDIKGAIVNGRIDTQKLVNLLNIGITETASEPVRFVASGTSIEIHQSSSGNPILVSSADSARINFTNNTLADYDGETVTIDGKTYTFMTAGADPTNPLQVDISGIATGEDSTAANVMNALNSAIKKSYENEPNPDRYKLFQVSGSTLISTDNLITASSLGGTLQTFTGIGDAVSGRGKTNGQQGVIDTINTGDPMVVTNTFTFNAKADAETGCRIPAVCFNADGTPKYINVDSIAIEWATGAEDMTGNYDEANRLSLFLGDANTSNGLTHLSGDYTTNYIKQDGAKYGSYTGVSISEDGIVTALFDNGETRPIAQIPLATFVDSNSLEALTGNTWIETDSSGQPTLRTAGEAGSGKVTATALENSTADIATEFTNMITTQRAYSAAAKIITTSDSMLEELMTIKR